jgi:hypothetical protein
MSFSLFRPSLSPKSELSDEVPLPNRVSLKDAQNRCLEMKEKYHVVVGQSWGDLTYPLQQEWLEYSCDTYFAVDNFEQKEPGKIVFATESLSNREVIAK